MTSGRRTRREPWSRRMVIGWSCAALLALVTIAFGIQQVAQSPSASPGARTSPAARTTSMPDTGSTILPSSGSADMITLHSDSPAAHNGATPCIDVPILSSLENIEMARALARAYMAQPRDIDGHCVHVTVRADLSGVAETEAHTGFSDVAAADRPVIWLPDSSAWLRLADDGTGSSVVPDHGTSVARTAIVLAMPENLADALGWISQAPTWATIFRTMETPDVWAKLGHPEWGSFKVGKASPQLATSGLLSLAASYLVANGGSSLTPADVDSPREVSDVRKTELATSHYMSTPQNFLFHAKEAQADGSIASFLSAMFMDEVTVWDWNRGVTSTPGMRMGMDDMNMGDMGTGDSSGSPGMSSSDAMSSSGGMSSSASPATSDSMSSDSMSSDSMSSDPMSSGSMPSSGSSDATGPVLPPSERLVPIYPSDGVFEADNPATIVNGSWVSHDQRDAAADFIRYARTEQGQSVVRANGYRDINDMTSSDVSDVALTLRDPKIIATPDAQVLSAVQQSFTAVRKPARVLFLLDVSRSMNGDVRPGVTKLDAAKHAVRDALNYFGPDDSVGLATFPNTPNGQLTPALVSPVTPLGTGRSSFLSGLRSLQTAPSTPLYEAVSTFATQLQQGYNPDDINAIIVLSDGRNHSDNTTTRASMLQTLQQVHAQVPLLVFTLGYGHNADVSTLQSIAEATGGHYFGATNPATVNQVLANELVTSF